MARWLNWFKGSNGSRFQMVQGFKDFNHKVQGFKDLNGPRLQLVKEFKRFIGSNG